MGKGETTVHGGRIVLPTWVCVCVCVVHLNSKTISTGCYVTVWKALWSLWQEDSESWATATPPPTLLQPAHPTGWAQKPSTGSGQAKGVRSKMTAREEPRLEARALE